jgi:molecular chaperone GrpE (heat shock protein)
VRVNLRLAADTHAVVKRLATHKESSVSALVQGLIEGMRPQLDQLAATLDQADTIENADQGVEVLEQLKAVAAHARSQADKLDVMVSAWQQGVRDSESEGKRGVGS